MYIRAPEIESVYTLIFRKKPSRSIRVRHKKHTKQTPSAFRDALFKSGEQDTSKSHHGRIKKSKG
jgi:hypothetical protein